VAADVEISDDLGIIQLNGEIFPLRILGLTDVQGYGSLI
jgi:hypothetical protein